MSPFLVEVAVETGTYVEGLRFGVALTCVALLLGVVVIGPVLLLRAILGA